MIAPRGVKRALPARQDMKNPGTSTVLTRYKLGTGTGHENGQEKLKKYKILIK